MESYGLDYNDFLCNDSIGIYVETFIYTYLYLHSPLLEVVEGGGITLIKGIFHNSNPSANFFFLQPKNPSYLVFGNQ